VNFKFEKIVRSKVRAIQNLFQKLEEVRKKPHNLSHPGEKDVQFLKGRPVFVCPDFK
jgi:hypothetical protein